MPRHPCGDIVGVPVAGTPLEPGSYVHAIEQKPAVGDVVYVYARGRVRPATVIKVTPTRVQVAYSTPSNRERVYRPWHYVGGRSYACVLDRGAVSGVPSWRVDGSSASPRYGHLLTPVEALGWTTARPPYSVAPALPAEQQDPKLNPGGGPLGWVVVDADEQMISFGDGYMSERVASARAASLNRGGTGNDVPNDAREGE